MTKQSPNRWRNVRHAALTGTVYAFVVSELASLLYAAYCLINSDFHPLVIIYCFIAVPVITLAGTLMGACCGFLYALLCRRRSVPDHRQPRSIGRLMLRAMLIMASGNALILIGTVTWAVIAHRPIARLESLGGYIHHHSATVSFADETLDDDDLIAVIECLNDVERWQFLDLSNTRVTGSGLRHLQAISHYGYYLTLSRDHLDDDGLSHLRELTNMESLTLDGHVGRATREDVRRALPNVQYIEYHEDHEQFTPFGGSVDTANGSVSFYGQALSSNDLPTVIDHLNNVEWDWHQLNLTGTGVRGNGLRHLQGISHPGYHLVLSSHQLDNEGLNHLGALTNIDTLWVAGHVPPETREKVRRALPNARSIHYMEDPDFGVRARLE